MKNICICNNCGGVLKDENPQVGAIEWPDDIFTVDMIYVSNRISDEESYCACPYCVTDSFLRDTTLEDAGKIASDEFIISKMEIHNDSESVDISINQGLEVDSIPLFYWHIEEIEEDATIMQSIVNAIRLFYENPKKLIELSTFRYS